MKKRTSSIVRTIWCDDCNTPREHEVVYGSKTQDGNLYTVIFHSSCLFCLENRDISKFVLHEVPARDWNALVSKEIYKKW